MISLRHRWFLLFILLLLLWLSILEFNRDQHLSPAGSMSLSLWHRFPGTPTNEADSIIDWGITTRSNNLHPQGFLSNFLSLDPNGPGFGVSTHYVGSTAWSSRYPSPSTIGPLPKRQWIRRFQFIKNRASQASNQSQLIHDLLIPPGSLQPDGYVNYPEALELGPGPLGACSWERSGCLRNPKNGYQDDLDIIDADNRTWVVNFDDGPLPPSKSLYDALDEFNVKATHFWIGGNVLKYWRLALLADRRGDHLAVHTWSHSHLTSLTDHQVLGELGWTIQIIADLTGKIPKYFRPPYGNIDNRIRAIAKHVFGLETVIWNFDSVDWGLNQTYATGDQVDAADPATSPTLEVVVGLIDDFATEVSSGRNLDGGGLILEHELSEESVEAFKRSWKNTVGRQAFDRVGPLPVCLNDGHTDWYQLPTTTPKSSSS